MKRVLSLLLSLALVLGMGVSSAAENRVSGQDEVMEQVILTVKKTLDLNTDAYTEFSGNSYVSGARSQWSLSWYGDGGSLSVEADETGKIYSYYRYDYNQTYTASKGLHFPDYCYEDAVEDANAFIGRVLSRAESVVWEESADTLRARSRYGVFGRLYLNGLPTEVYVDLSINPADGSILSFRRGDSGSFVDGELPSAVPAFDAAEARTKFAPSVTGELQWVITDYETKEARLMYVFERDHGVVLDAQTGKLIGGADSRAVSNEKAAPTEAALDAAYGLTEVEKQGAEKFEGVLGEADLLAAARAETAFGITDAYTIGNVRYTANQAAVLPDVTEDGKEIDSGVTAAYTLRYVLSGADLGLSQTEYDALSEAGYQPAVNKYISADAHTGEVKSLSTWYNGFGWEERKVETEPVISQTALDFLNARYGAYMAHAELWNHSRSTRGMSVDSFSYVRVQDGYPLYANSISVTVNSATGYIDSFSCVWDDAVCFGPSAPLVCEESALAHYLDTYEAVLGYSMMPENPEDWETAYYWLLTYTLESDGWCSQVDALTGEAEVHRYSDSAETPDYHDLEESYAAQEIKKLAKFGVGYYGVTQFQPFRQVTELDMILFFLSAVGYRYDCNEASEREGEALNQLYRNAADAGFIASSAEPNPGRPVSRSELCRSFTALAGMTEAAGLKGVFACGFTDDSEIAEADYGFVAVAKGLGIVSGDAAGTFRPNDGATRQELALMLYRYLSR